MSVSQKRTNSGSSENLLAELLVAEEIFSVHD